MAYTVEQADLVKDRDVLSALWQRNYGDVDTGRFEWLYYKSDANPMCFVVKTKENEIVGMNGVLTRDVEAFGGTITIAHAIDFLIDKKHRTAGPAIQMQRYLIKELSSRNIKVIYGFPMPAAQLVLKRLGYKALGDYQRWVKPLNGSYVASKYLNTLLSTILSPIVNVGLQVYSGDVFYRFTKRKLINNNKIDERFDKFWECKKYSPVVVGKRDKKFLSWRFTEFYKSNYKVYTIDNAAGEIIGYIVYQVNDKVSSIHDLYVNEVKNYKKLLSCFSNTMRKQDIHYITMFILAPAKVMATLKSSGFMRRPETSKVYVRIDDEFNNLHPELSDYKSWYVTDADKDMVL